MWRNSMFVSVGLNQTELEESDIKWHTTKIIWHIHYSLQDGDNMSSVKRKTSHSLSATAPHIQFIFTLGMTLQLGLARPSLMTQDPHYCGCLDRYTQCLSLYFFFLFLGLSNHSSDWYSLPFTILKPKEATSCILPIRKWLGMSMLSLARRLTIKR